MKVSRYFSTCAAAALATSVAIPALAQASGTAAESSAGGQNADAPTSDIVVTARRRAEDISRVPTSVTALGAEALTQRSVSTQADLQMAVPGLIVRET